MRRFLDFRFALSLLMGFSAGLPLLLTRSTLKTWLTVEKIDLKVVGFFSLVILPYSYKFLWAPAMDRWDPLGLGRRRSWLLISQLGLVAGLLALAFIQPGPDTLAWVAIAAVWTALCGASQDIVVDAYRRETFRDEELGLASANYVLGYRVALLAAGAGALYIADYRSWHEAYVAMAALMACGIGVTFFAKEPAIDSPAPKTFQDAVVAPLTEFFKRKEAFLILAFVLFYKIGEQMASDMLNPFLVKIGFQLKEIASVAKVFGFWATIGGGIAGGWLIMKMPLTRALFIFGILQSAALLLFAVLAEAGPRSDLLALAVAAENFTSGMATSAYMAFMASQTNRRFTATQYALLSSLLGVASMFAGATTGVLAVNVGWTAFFIICVACTIPGLALIYPLKRLAVTQGAPPSAKNASA